MCRLWQCHAVWRICIGNAKCGEEKQVPQQTDSAQMGDLARGGSRAKRYLLEGGMQTSDRHNIARMKARRMAWEHSAGLPGGSRDGADAARDSDQHQRRGL
jgi:hypothetical protein